MAFARSYAQAFLQATPSGYDVEGFLARAASVARALGQDLRLKAFFATPAVPKEAKKKVLQELTRKVELDDFGERLFQVVLGNRRLLQISHILSAIREQWDRQSGVVAARVTVASPIGPPEEKRIAEGLARAIGRRVRLQVDVNREILAGFVARVGSEVFDASALHAIERFREQAQERTEA